ncbi:MAG TPA: hypothetical protein VMD91_06605 [Candidatus Sulfotelmatobacter sp.]|nr:hypothetical protein [Candidatus Sulfotelmatobacter sp.]
MGSPSGEPFAFGRWPIRTALVLAAALTLAPLAAGSQVTNPAPGPSASPAPLAFAQPRVGVVPGGTLAVGLTGGTPPYTLTASFAVGAAYDPAQNAVVLSGRAPGAGTVTATDASGASTSLAVLVAPAAGVVPADTDVRLGGTVGADFAQVQTQTLIGAVAQLRPGATLAVGGLNLPAQLPPGTVLDLPAPVTIAGNGRWVDVSGTTTVHLRVDRLSPLVPTTLFYSDDPERITAAMQGVLFRGTIDPTHPVRLYAYHLADRPRRLVLVLNATGGMESDVQLVGAAAGPSQEFAYVGHLSTVRYLLARAAQQSVVLPVTPDAPFFLDLGILTPGQLVAAVDDLRVLDGNTLDAMIVAVDPNVDPANYLRQPTLAGDGHGRRGEFSLVDVPPLALSYTVGAAEPAPFVIGRPTLPNLVPGGRALGGDYGIIRRVALHLVNPTQQTQNVYLYEQLGHTTGGTTTTMWFTGDPAPIQVPCIGHPDTRYLVRGFALAPGADETVGGDYMTDGTSSFPLYFGLTSTPPVTLTKSAC